VSLTIALIAGAWGLILFGQATGSMAAGHAHASPFIGAAPAVLAFGAFLLGWQVMVAATMLPASLPAMRAVAKAVPAVARHRWHQTVFLASFVGVWTAFGGLAFAGALAVQRAVVAWPWLATRPWLVDATLIAFAAAYQFTPLKRRSLQACRNLMPTPADRWAGGPSATRLGLAHGVACVGSAGVLMLAMVVAGLGDLWWMAALTVVMVYEATGRYGEQAARAVGLLLLLLAALIVLPGWLPA